MEIQSQQFAALREMDEKFTSLVSKISESNPEKLGQLQEELLQLENNRRECLNEIEKRAKSDKILATCGGKKLSEACPDDCKIAGTVDMCTGDFFHNTEEKCLAWD